MTVESEEMLDRTVGEFPLQSVSLSSIQFMFLVL
jgi:hypothetical protein